MASVYDVAKYILETQGEMTAMKLQKLVYYAQAWHLVWEEEPLFDEKIEAWINGPVCPDLYRIHSGHFKVNSDLFDMCGSANSISPNQKDSINKVLAFYGNKSSQWLSDLTHSEEPWIRARDGLAPNDRGNREIILSSLAEYYESL
ncbi:TPA: Panacea domain-containing protein [Legionella bozemanae]